MVTRSYDETEQRIARQGLSGESYGSSHIEGEDNQMIESVPADVSKEVTPKS